MTDYRIPARSIAKLSDADERAASFVLTLLIAAGVSVAFIGIYAGFMLGMWINS